MGVLADNMGFFKSCVPAEVQQTVWMSFHRAMGASFHFGTASEGECLVTPTGLPAGVLKRGKGQPLLSAADNGPAQSPCSSHGDFDTGKMLR